MTGTPGSIPSSRPKRSDPGSFSLLLFTQIAPRRIHRIDKPDLFLASPSFELLFARNSSGCVREFFEPDQPANVVGRREPRNLLQLVFVNSASEIVRDPDV